VGASRSNPVFRAGTICALTNLRPTHLLDPQLFDFVALARSRDKIEKNPLQLVAES